MTKAKSRLQTTAATPLKKTSSRWPKHLRYLPLLVIGFICWAGLGFTLTTLSPDQVQHVLLPHLYLPVIVLFGLGCFFTLAFITLHSRRALMVSLAATALVFFRLQQFTLTWQLVGSILIFFGILELSLTLLHRSQQHQASSEVPSRANIKSQADQPKRN